MKPIATIDLFAGSQAAGRTAEFRGRDNWSLSDKRRCLRLNGGETLEFTFSVADPGDGIAELVFTGCLEIYDSHAYIRKHLNSVLEIRLNGTLVFDGILHWRSHEETVAFWNPFDFPFDASLLQEGENTVVLKNQTSRETLGEFFDPQLLEHFAEAEAVRKLSTLYLSSLEVNFVRPPVAYPRLNGVPRTAVAGQSFIVEIDTGDEAAEVVVASSENAVVEPCGREFEFGAWRTLFAVTPAAPASPCTVMFEVNGKGLTATVDQVYAEINPQEFITGPGAETTYWHMLKTAAQDFFALESGNCLRMSIDDYLANLHFIPLAKWQPLISYLVRRRRYYALQRLRVPPYSKIQHEELIELANMGGQELFAGVAVPEPVLFFHRNPQNKDLQESLEKYLAYFEQRMAEIRLPGHRLVTFDSAGGLCGHYYRLGLDAHITELGPACNCFEESCCRGAATAYGRPWGIATAMHWYCGQGAQYAYDDARVRFAWLTMLSSYLAGARHILWEGGVFDNLPVYNYLLSEESWRDYGRRYPDPEPAAVRACFGKLLDFHRAQQLPSPKVRFAILRGTNDLFAGMFGNDASAHGDMSLARAWTLLKVFLPHVSWGRWGTDHGRQHRRWYSATPYGQVDVLPAEAAQEHYNKYQVLALLSWNTMSDELYERLCAYVENGGVLFAALPHFCIDTAQQHEWRFYQDGDLSRLCGIKAKDVGPRLESVKFQTDMFSKQSPRKFELSRQNPLFVEDFDEVFPVFSLDVSYFTGEIEVVDAEVLAASQSGAPVLLRRKLGKGTVYLLNTYHHIGRGRLLDLAEGVLRGLVEEQIVPIKVKDPRQVVAHFEYPAEKYTRYFFLNTDWTTGDNAAPVTVTLGDDSFSFEVPEGRPVQLLSDGRRHVLLSNPAIQVTAWKSQQNALHLEAVGGSAAQAMSFGSRQPVLLNGEPVPPG